SDFDLFHVNFYILKYKHYKVTLSSKRDLYFSSLLVSSSSTSSYSASTTSSSADAPSSSSAACCSCAICSYSLTDNCCTCSSNVSFFALMSSVSSDSKAFCKASLASSALAFSSSDTLSSKSLIVLSVVKIS